MSVALLRRVGNRLGAAIGRDSGTRTREYRCEDCGVAFESSKASRDMVACHTCSSENVHRLVRHQQTWWQRRDHRVRLIGKVLLLEVGILGLAIVLELLSPQNPEALGGAPMIAGLLGALAVIIAAGTVFVVAVYVIYLVFYTA